MRLSDIATISAGHSFRGKLPELIGSGIYAVQLKDVSQAGVNWKSCIETEITGKATPKFLEPNDILFIARGNKNFAVLVDKTATQQKTVASPHFYLIKVDTKKVEPEFLAWLLNQQHSQRYFQRESEGSLAKSIRRNVLENTTITLPSLEKQQQVVRLVTTISKEQDTLQQLIDNGKQTMTAIANQLLNEHSKG